MILYAAADNTFTADFFGQTLSGSAWNHPNSISVDISGKTCSKF